MKKFKLKNRSEVIIKCIDLAMYQESTLDLISYLNPKLNRLLYSEALIKKIISTILC